MRRCSVCGEQLSATKRADARYCSPRCGNRERGRRHYQRHPEAYAEKRWSTNSDASRRMWTRVKSRAKRLGLPFDIDVSDIIIPSTCPVLGIPIQAHSGRKGCFDDSPSLDRIEPALGYTRGNVRVISGRANLLKSNATLAEMRAVLADLEAITCSSGTSKATASSTS